MKTFLALIFFLPAVALAQGASSLSDPDRGQTGIPYLDGVAPPDVIPGSVPPPRVPAIDAAAPPPATAPVPATSTLKTPPEPPPPVNLLSGVDSVLTPREHENLAVARSWIDGRRDRASPGADGSVVFRLGTSMPSVICAPLYVCDIALQPGEAVSDVKVGDPVRWRITPATSASTTHVIVKPSDIGLQTNLIVATDRRVYNIRLVSREHDWMPSVSFSYPEDEAAAWARVQSENARRTAESVIPSTGESIDRLDFGFRLKGDKPAWRPVRVYSVSGKTIIQFPRAMQHDEAPALVAIGPGKEHQLVNYRTDGDRYIVDKVLTRAILVAGVGRHQTRVVIDREESR